MQMVGQYLLNIVTIDDPLTDYRTETRMVGQYSLDDVTINSLILAIYEDENKNGRLVSSQHYHHQH
jgi:hypothetical protein